MKNQPGFIPDSISAISGASLQIQVTHNLEHSEAHHDSTDMFIDQILRQRVQRLQKEDEKGEKTSVHKQPEKALQESKELQQNNATSQFRLKQSLMNSRDRQSKFQLLMFQNQSIQQKSQVSEGQQSKSKSQAKMKSKISEGQEKKQNVIVEDRVETLQNQTNQQVTIERQPNKQTSVNIQKDKQEKQFKFFKINNNLSGSELHSRQQNDSHQSRQSQQIKVHQDFKIKQNVSMSKQQPKFQSNDNSILMINNVHNELLHHSQLGETKKMDELKQSYSQIQKRQKKNQSISSNSQSSRTAKGQNRVLKNNESKYDSPVDMLETPIRSFHEQKGVYEFVDQKKSSQHQSDNSYRQMALAITQHLNQNDKRQSQKKMSDNDFSLGIQNPRKSASSFKNKSVKDYVSSQKRDSDKLEIPQDDAETQYSQSSRDIKILQHRYVSNLNYLSSQTVQLLGYYNFMIMEEEKKELRKQIMTQQIKNNRQKIWLRGASFAKRFNFISPVAKNNDKPIDFKPKKRVSEVLLYQCKQLAKEIQEEKITHVENEHKLNLLVSYYQLMKSKKICDNLPFPTEYQFDSSIGGFSPIKCRETQDQFYNSGNIFPQDKNNIKGQLSKNKSQSNFMKSKTLTGFSKIKKINQIERTPEAMYNIMKYKTQIAKDMITEFQVFNLNRAKRMKDQTRILKKELEFVEKQIEHFDLSFAEELRAFQESKKPKLSYNTFKTQEKQIPYSKSPFNRDYHANSKGMNNINIYRPDSPYTSPQKKNESLSQSRYTIQRERVNDNSSSRKQFTISLNFSVTDKQHISAKKLNPRKKFLSPPSNLDQYGMVTMGQNLMSIKQIPQRQISSQKIIRPNRSQKSLSLRDKNVIRFKREANTEHNISEAQPISTKVLFRTGMSSKPISPVKKKTQSSYNISLQQSQQSLS